MDLERNKVVTLQGVTRHGKNRIHEQGDTWIVIKVDNNAVLLESTKNTDWLRWLNLPTDKNFRILPRDNDDTIENLL